MGSSSLTRVGTWAPRSLHWECRGLASGPPGKSSCGCSWGLVLFLRWSAGSDVISQTLTDCSLCYSRWTVFKVLGVVRAVTPKCSQHCQRGAVTIRSLGGAMRFGDSGSGSSQAWAHHRHLEGLLKCGPLDPPLQCLSCLVRAQGVTFRTNSQVTSDTSAGLGDNELFGAQGRGLETRHLLLWFQKSVWKEACYRELGSG